MYIQILAAVMLVAGGLFTGGAFFVAWVRIPVWRRQDAATFTADFRLFIRRADPMQPILLMICCVASAWFGASSAGAQRLFALIATALLAGVLVVSLLVAEPINSTFRQSLSGTVPADCEGLRRSWSRLHYARTSMAVAALVLLAVAGAGV